MDNTLRSVGLAERATVLGYRSSSKNWTLEQTDTPWAVSGVAFAHILGNSTEQAYARYDLFERRRKLMQMWAYYVLNDPNVQRPTYRYPGRFPKIEFPAHHRLLLRAALKFTGRHLLAALLSSLASPRLKGQ